MPKPDDTQPEESMTNGHLNLKLVGVDEDDPLMNDLENIRGEDDRMDLLIDSVMEIRSQILM